MHWATNIKHALGLAILATIVTGIGCTYKTTIVEPTPEVKQPATPVATPAPEPAAPVVQPAPAPQPAPTPAVAVPQPTPEPPPQPAKPPSTIEERRGPPQTVVE